MKRKKLLITALLSIICLVIFYYLFIPTISFVKDGTMLEKGQTYMAEDFVEKANGEVIPEREILDTDNVGVYSLNYKIKKYFIEREVTFFYTVVDTTPPIITIKQHSIKVDPDELLADEDIRNNVALNEGTFEYETDYDPLYSGSYIVYVEAKDEYNNMSHDKYEIVVNDVEAPLVLRSGNGTIIQ